MVEVRKKQRMSKRAIVITKIKLEGVSKPREWARKSIGPGKMAIIIKAKGRSNQATDIFTDMEFLRRLLMIKMRRMRAAIETSI